MAAALLAATGRPQKGIEPQLAAESSRRRVPDSDIASRHNRRRRRGCSEVGSCSELLCQVFAAVDLVVLLVLSLVVGLVFAWRPGRPPPSSSWGLGAGLAPTAPSSGMHPRAPTGESSAIKRLVEARFSAERSLSLTRASEATLMALLLLPSPSGRRLLGVGAAPPMAPSAVAFGARLVLMGHQKR